MGWKTWPACVLAAGFCGGLVLLAGTVQAGPDMDDGDDPVALVQQLGAPDFAARERAMNRLVAQGVAAIDALEQGVQSPDRETSFRSRRALAIVRAMDFQRRLQAFANGRDAEESYQLPGWAMFHKETGGGMPARSLFVEMQKSESELLRIMEESPDKVGEAMFSRLFELQAEAQQQRSPVQLSLGTVVTILFILNTEQSRTSARAAAPMFTGQEIGTYFRQPSFANAITSGTHRELLRKMLGKWIAHSEGHDAYYAMLLAFQYELPQALIPARKFLDGTVSAQGQPYYRYNALLAFARFGDESHIPLIEPFLEDATPYGRTFQINGNAKYLPQIRDVALATLIQLVKEDHRKFGFQRLTRSSTSVFNSNSLAFEDDAAREAAIKKWREFWAARQKKSNHRPPAK